ncbi:MAG: hypothetical protein M5U19_06435 [Microthrixaceae bacterium]|nr:hypothetical protein [Microthrixaceae bacterium]
MGPVDQLDTGARPHEASALRFGISAVVRELRGHPLAPVVEAVVEACRLAEQAGAGLQQHLVSAGAIRLVGGAIGSEGVAGAADPDEIAAVEDRIAG